MRPKRSIAAATAASTDSCLVTSSSTASTVVGYPAIRSANCSGRRAAETTYCPRSNHCLTSSQPKPADVPVINHTRCCINSPIFPAPVSFALRSMDCKPSIAAATPPCTAPDRHGSTSIGMNRQGSSWPVEATIVLEHLCLMPRFLRKNQGKLPPPPREPHNLNGRRPTPNPEGPGHRPGPCQLLLHQLLGVVHNVRHADAQLLHHDGARCRTAEAIHAD